MLTVICTWPLSLEPGCKLMGSDSSPGRKLVASQVASHPVTVCLLLLGVTVMTFSGSFSKYKQCVWLCHLSCIIGFCYCTESKLLAACFCKWNHEDLWIWLLLPKVVSTLLICRDVTLWFWIQLCLLICCLYSIYCICYMYAREFSPHRCFQLRME